MSNTRSLWYRNLRKLKFSTLCRYKNVVNQYFWYSVLKKYLYVKGKNRSLNSSSNFNWKIMDWSVHVSSSWKELTGLCRRGGDGWGFQVYHLFSHLIFYVDVWGGIWFRKHLQPEDAGASMLKEHLLPQPAVPVRCVDFPVWESFCFRRWMLPLLSG